MNLTLAEARERLLTITREIPALDLAIAGVLALAGLLQVARQPNLFTLVGVLLATLPLAVRHLHPAISVLLPLAGLALTLVDTLDPRQVPIAVYLAGMICFYTLLRLFPRPWAWAAGGSVAVGWLVLGGLYVLSDDLSFYDNNRVDLSRGATFVAAAVITAVITLLADVRRSRTEVTQVRAHNVETLRAQAAMAERARIAREMHDIVAHSISMIAVQAESAPYTLQNLDDPAKREFAEIAGSARQTLSEMRRLLGVLRADTPRVRETAPQPGLALLPQLFLEHGGPVDLDIVGDERALPQAVDLSAYRIVQEALTNVRVHAPGARVSIELAYRPEILVMRISDNGPGPLAQDRGSASGHGLVGMRERALGLGGWFNAEPGPAGGFLITVGLPLE